MSLKPLTPPLRFSTVAFACTDQPQPPWQASAAVDDTDPRSHPHHRESVYRGAYPKARNLSFLSRLHLRTVLSLTPRPLDNDVAILEWASSTDSLPSSSLTTVAGKASKLGIQLFHVRCEKPKEESGGLTREGAARALSILLDRRNHPIYIHCLDGVEVTSTLVACLRKVQAWSNPAILAELGRALRDSNSSEWTEVPSHLSAFLTKFGQPDGVRLPPRNHIPSWLWPAPNMLSVLADPYAWAASSHPPHLSNGHVQHSHSSASSTSNEPSMSRNPSYTTALNGSCDTNVGVASRTSPHPPIHPRLRRDRQLPIHHPTLKLHFDIDPDLPPEPVFLLSSASASSASTASSQRPSTPSRSLHMHSRTSSHNSNASWHTPPHSRPTSRAGRPSTNSSQLHAGRSASLMPDEDRAGTAGQARRAASTARGITSSLISPSPTSTRLQAPTSVIPCVAAFLEDQVQGHDAVGSALLSHQQHDSPTRRARSNLAQESRLYLRTANETPQESGRDSDSTQRTPTSTILPDADTEEVDVSTPRARPTTSSNYKIGIAGTIFHHDDDITDNEAEHAGCSQTQAVRRHDAERARITVPLEQRRRRLVLDDAGEQTPTKANGLAQTSWHVAGQRTADVLSERIAAMAAHQATRNFTSSDSALSKDSSLSETVYSAHSSIDGHRPVYIVQSPTSNEPDDDRASASQTTRTAYPDKQVSQANHTQRARTEATQQDDQEQDDQEQDNAEHEDVDVQEQDDEEDEEEDEDDEEEEEEDDEEEEDEEDEEEDEEDDEEDEEDEDDEDDLALQALDLEGY
ncbi:uncharacterized protein UMAG_11656 [Mycosarcoma maydis]|uniref:Tyrosine specific protein phosphatases domain-containing protein n=1 Tax=Mycosarcoma maydis TaxID=5270 RepID=A0A0D1CAA5_MYCMD|nr:uncharacterized protein UMAG_11656 [Ustilago maydis 521]KIS70277.1 hypothetical protein UMAG_11656 [Ustilago maydis 521]|eukprot:XP_011388053.1 hypothetical protein UMAG_11656 [Ustilago maydis 521]